MPQTEISYKAIRRWKELYSPVPFTNNLQIWLTSSAIGLAVFTLLYNFVFLWMQTYGINLPNLYSIVIESETSNILIIIVGILGLAGLSIFLFCLGSMIYLFFQAFKNKKIVVNPENIQDSIRDGMSEEEKKRISLMLEGINMLSKNEIMAKMDDLSEQYMQNKIPDATVDHFENLVIAFAYQQSVNLAKSTNNLNRWTIVIAILTFVMIVTTVANIIFC